MPLQWGLQAYGSTGDIRATIAVAAGLVRAGHAVRLQTIAIDGQDHGPVCASLGIRHQELGDPAFDLDAFSRRCAGIRDPHRQIALLLQPTLYARFEHLYQASLELCAASDALVAHFMALPLVSAARRGGRPCANLVLTPGMLPTAAYPPAARRRTPNAGRWANALLWKGVERLVDQQIAPPLRAAWRERGIPPFRRLLTDVWLSRELNLVLASRHLFPPPGYGKVPTRTCGFARIPAASEPAPLHPELAAFLAQGPPPVYFTFGSLQHQSERGLRELVGETAARAGCRAILQLSGAGAPVREGDVLVVGAAPHQAVFPACAAVVHHSGAQTAQTVAFCGVPTVPVPFIAEQWMWARAMHDAGVATAPLASDRATPRRLAARVSSVLRDEGWRRRAAALSGALAEEDGVANSVAALEELAAAY